VGAVRLVRRRILLALVLTIAALTSARAEPQLIALDQGTYRAVVPPAWDGRSALPLVMYLHGFREDSGTISGNAGLVAAVTSLDALLIIPDGVDQNWSHRGAPSQKRDDLAFLHDVVADAEKRWPVDQARVFATGFSIGASMVWDLACHDAKGFAAFLPFSGDFWTPYPARCESGPVELRHTHAINDHTFPMEGRALFNGQYHQGDIHQSFAIIEASDDCATQPDEKTRDGDLDCESWTRCGSGKQLEMCLHTGDHQIQPDWLHRSVLWALQRVAAKS
jgi:polyhydroxybutyrate depolymerase